MSDSLAGRMGPSPSRAAPQGQQGSSANLADILERVLDKGVVIAGDIQINLLDIELLTIKLRLLVVSVDKAKEMGIDWWESDPSLSSGARELRRQTTSTAVSGNEGGGELAAENERLRKEIERLRAQTELPAAGQEAGTADAEAVGERSGGDEGTGKRGG